jgi:peptide deformylase
MAILPILRFPDPVLRETCREADPLDPLLAKLAADMTETMYAAPGVGLAAPQVGVPVRMVVVDPAGPEGPRRPITMVNPVIVFREGSVTFEEGCLSLPEFRLDVPRSRSITVRFTDLAGRVGEIAAEDLPAVVIQHELDHLEGRLILDQANLLRREAYRRAARRHAFPPGRSAGA